MPRKSAPALTLLLAEAANADRWIASEAQLQECTARLLDAIGLLWCHVPNGGLRNKNVAAQLKRHGVKPGVPDVMIFEKFSTNMGHNLGYLFWCGCAIELKYGRNNPTAKQYGWLNKLKDNLWYTKVCRSMAEVVETLRHCGYIDSTIDCGKP
jgi:hypothetical protein